MPIAQVDWCLDSGGFTELSLHGRWETTPEVYVQAVRRYSNEIGRLRWASQQDFMCEPAMLERTGLSIREHQRLTIENFLALRSLASDLPFIPVLQGQTLDDYLRHMDQFDRAGISLLHEPIVGVGSVCRRQATSEIVEIISGIARTGVKLHGFGMKTLGLRRVHQLMGSADSMAWSFTARRQQIRLPDCTHKARRCSDCLTFAMKWRSELLSSLEKSEGR